MANEWYSVKSRLKHTLNHCHEAILNIHLRRLDSNHQRDERIFADQHGRIRCVEKKSRHCQVLK